MSSEWRECSLDDVAELTGGYAFKSSQYQSNGVFVLRTLNIGDDGSITQGDAVFVSDADAREFSRFQLCEKDILFVMVGATLGKIGKVSKSILPALLNQNMWRIRARRDLVDQDFLYYSFKECVLEIIGWASGSARGFLRRDDCRSLRISLPTLEEQKEIAHILGTLDDKIELNRKTNETLEAMAKALFKSWFVDFDPVRAKVEGRPTGLPDEISELFPDSFEDSELGEIPRGWSVAALSDIARISTGKRPESVADFRSSANHIPVYGGAGVMGYTRNALTDGEPILATGRVGTLGVVNRVLEKAWISDNTLIVNPGKSDFVYVYHFLLTQDLKSLNRGSTQPLLSQTELKSLPIARPPQSLLSTFCELTQHWQERQASLLKDDVNTKALLDTLLPKLISGQIRIPDAERMLEEAGV